MIIIVFLFSSLLDLLLSFLVHSSYVRNYEVSIIIKNGFEAIVEVSLGVASEDDAEVEVLLGENVDFSLQVLLTHDWVFFVERILPIIEFENN